MKFVQAQRHLYWWPITVKLPHPDKTGLWITESFRMRFDLVGADEARAIREGIAAMEAAERALHEHDLLLRAARDWDDVVDGDGLPVPYSAEALMTVLQSSWHRLGIYESWQRSLMPGEARRGN